MTSSPKTRIALIGECMLELQGQAFGAMTQGFGGDTLNTAVYLARCGGPQLSVSYATGLGDDRFSGLMMDAWAQEGIALDLVCRLPGRLPGLYMIELSEAGERSFSYWRDNAAARSYFDAPSTPLEDRVSDWDAFYLSGISLAILPPAGRERLFALMRTLRDRGARVVFDNNYRPRLWADADTARACFERAFALANVALVTADDHQLLIVLLAEDGDVRLHLIEQLGDDQGDATEHLRPEIALQAQGGAGHGDAGREAVGIHFLGRGGEHQVTAGAG